MKYHQKDINERDEWEKFWLSVKPEALFQSWLWGEVQQKLNTKLWRLGWYQGSTLVAIAQVTKVEAKRGRFLHLRHGPITREPNHELWSQIINDLKELGKQEKTCFLRISPLIADTKENQALVKALHFQPAAIHAMDAERCWVLDLTQSEDDLLAAMRKTTRYEIRQALKAEIKLVTDASDKELHNFLKLYQQTARRHEFVEHQGIKDEFELYTREKQGMLINGYVQNQLIAGALILFSGQQAIYHHGASIPNKIPVSYLVQWEAIKEAKRRGVRVYNFWGIAPEDKPQHPWRGITLFKQGFGGRLVNYLHAQDLPLNPWYYFSRAIESWRKWKKRY